MLSRFFFRSLRLRPLALTLTSNSPPLPHHHSPSFPPPAASSFIRPHLRLFSKKRSSGLGGGGGGEGGVDGTWDFNSVKDDTMDSLFSVEEGTGNDGGNMFGEGGDEWGGRREEKRSEIFEDMAKDVSMKEKDDVAEEWETAEGFKPWDFGEAGEEGKGDLFLIGEEDGTVGDLDGVGEVDVANQKAEDMAKVEMEENELMGVLKGPNRAFGDLIAASGITDEMLDSLILLKNVSGVEGLPPLKEIEDSYAEKGDDTSRHKEVLKKQQEVAEARVRKVDEKGRAYGTGKRKCSIARVFIQRGDGKFIVNDKQFDAYFSWLDHRAEILSPFLVTETVGCWDVNCTVKGGGLSGQVGAIRLGISRALQNWSPVFRELLRPAGLLTRDSRVVERKKPGKAKARKSFQWVKR